MAENTAPATNKARKKDKRSIATESNIRKALLSVMLERPFHQISVIDICKSAGVSRVTFYSHYENIADVLDQVLDEVAKTVSDGPVSSLSFCSGEDLCDNRLNEKGIPLCELANSENVLQPIFADPSVSKMAITKIVDHVISNKDFLKQYSELPENQLRCILTFRMNGCLSTIQMAKEQGIDWSCAKETIDDFVLRGMNGV